MPQTELQGGAIDRISSATAGIRSSSADAKGLDPVSLAGLGGALGNRNPFAQLGGLLAKLIMGHVGPLKKALDRVSLDQGAAQALAEQWQSQFPQALLQQRDQLAQLREQVAEHWQGAGAPQAFANRQVALEELGDALMEACAEAGALTAKANELLTQARYQIEEWIGDLIGGLVQRLAAVAATFWVPIFGEIHEAIFLEESIRKIVTVSQKIEKLIKRVEGVLREVAKAGQEIAKTTKGLDKLIGKTGRGVRPSRAGNYGPGRLKGASTHSQGGEPAFKHVPQAKQADKPAYDGKPHEGNTSGVGAQNGHGGSAPKTRSLSEESTAPMGARGEGPSAGRDSVKCSRDPVDVATGAVVLQQTDVDLPGVLPLRLVRTHVSSYRSGRSFGATWSSTLDQRLEVDHEGVAAVGEDGAVHLYAHPEPDAPSLLPERGDAWRLSIEDGHYKLTDPQAGFSKRFGLAGAVPAADQPAALLPLRSVEDDHGNTITFRRTEDGRPTEVVHSGGYRVLVHTDGDRVTGLSLAEASARDARHDAPLLVRFGYEQGRLVTVANTAPGELQFGYDQAGRLTSWTDRNQVRFDYQYDEQGRCASQRSTLGAMASTFAYREFPDGGRETVVTDSLGGGTVYRMDERLRVVEETDQLGRTVRTEFDDRDRVVAVVDPTGARTVYERDHTGEITAVVRPDGARTEYEHHSPGKPSRVTHPDGSVQEFQYDQRGLLIGETDPAGGTKTYVRDARGAITSVADELGRATRFQVNAAGLPVERIDPDGATTRFEHDRFGRVAKAIDTTGAATALAWTPEGKLASRTSPDGAVEQWVYDGEGNLVEHIDPTGGVTRYEHGEFDKPVAITDPAGATTRYEWDTELRLVAVTNPQGLRWEYRHDPAGQLVGETDFSGRVLAYTYDGAGRRTSKTSVKTGQSVRYEHDLLGQLVSESTSDGETTRYTYDQLGRALSAVNQDAAVEFQRDQLGRVVAESINGRTTRWGFNAAGQRATRVTPSGVTTEWAYDPAGLLNQVTTNEQATVFERDQHGRVRHTWHSNDLVTVNEYDPAGRLASQGVRAGVAAAPGSSRQPVARTFAYDPAGRLASVCDNLRGETRYLRDQAQRVVHVEGDQWQEQYQYDPAGNITASAVTAEPAAVQNSFAGALPVKVGNREYDYDPDGRLTQTVVRRLDRKPDVWRYEWDANDRLRCISTPDGSVWKYSYDAYGRRIAKQQLSADRATRLSMTLFAWEGERLIEAVQQSNPTDAETLTWVYEERGTGFTPSTQTLTKVANQQQVDQRFYAIVTDLVGTPTELLDVATGELAGWQRQTLWGTTTWTGETSTPLRFAGQYHDPETGFHYNRYRHYNSWTGQFLTTDPLGLAPAENPRTYPHDPTGWTDPLGLSPCKTGGNGGGRASNKMRPDENATGDHTVFRTDENGKVTHYQTFNRNEQAPSGWRPGPRFRGEGRPHGGIEPPLYYPSGAGKAFPATGDQLPLGY